MSKTAKITDLLYEILRLQFYWIIYIFRGGIVAGIFPSTAAVFAIIRSQLLKKEDESLSKLFRLFYCENFKVANILGGSFALVTGVIIINFFYIPYYPESMRVSMYAIIVFMSFLLLIVWIYLFPTIVHFKLSISKLFLVILKTGFSSLFGTIIQIIVLGLLSLFMFRFPVFIFMFGIIPFALVQMLVSIHLFGNLE